MTGRAWPTQTARDDTPQVSCVNSYLHDGSLISGFSLFLFFSVISFHLSYCWHTYIVHTIVWLGLCFYDEFCGAFFIVLNIIFEAIHQGLKQD